MNKDDMLSYLDKFFSGDDIVHVFVKLAEQIADGH